MDIRVSSDKKAVIGEPVVTVQNFAFSPLMSALRLAMLSGLRSKVRKPQAAEVCAAKASRIRFETLEPRVLLSGDI
ncbi:MAG: LEPR-XLL domain-containing protein, partial [Polynucleobacter sp.]|nr:LEPR-XLL domain-containing protein [Polynucleobacter sp.]